MVRHCLYASLPARLLGSTFPSDPRSIAFGDRARKRSRPIRVTIAGALARSACPHRGRSEGHRKGYQRAVARHQRQPDGMARAPLCRGCSAPADIVGARALQPSRTYLRALPGVAHNLRHYPPAPTGAATLARPVLATPEKRRHCLARRDSSASIKDSVVPSCPVNAPKVSRGRRAAASGCHLQPIVAQPGPSVSIRPRRLGMRRRGRSVPAGTSPGTIRECHFRSGSGT